MGDGLVGVAKQCTRSGRGVPMRMRGTIESLGGSRGAATLRTGRAADVASPTRGGPLGQLHPRRAAHGASWYVPWVLSRCRRRQPVLDSPRHRARRHRRREPRHGRRSRGLDVRRAPSLEGWRSFDTIDLGGRDVDHMLIGPGGVYAIETKWSATRWSLTGLAGNQVERQAHRARKGARDIRLRLHSYKFGCPSPRCSSSGDVSSTSRCRTS